MNHLEIPEDCGVSDGEIAILILNYIRKQNWTATAEALKRDAAEVLGAYAFEDEVPGVKTLQQVVEEYVDMSTKQAQLDVLRDTNPVAASLLNIVDFHARQMDLGTVDVAYQPPSPPLAHPSQPQMNEANDTPPAAEQQRQQDKDQEYYEPSSPHQEYDDQQQQQQQPEQQQQQQQNVAPAEAPLEWAQIEALLQRDQPLQTQMLLAQQQALHFQLNYVATAPQQQRVVNNTTDNIQQQHQAEQHNAGMEVCDDEQQAEEPVGGAAEALDRGAINNEATNLGGDVQQQPQTTPERHGTQRKKTRPKKRTRLDLEPEKEAADGNNNNTNLEVLPFSPDNPGNFLDVWSMRLNQDGLAHLLEDGGLQSRFAQNLAQHITTVMNTNTWDKPLQHRGDAAVGGNDGGDKTTASEQNRDANKVVESEDSLFPEFNLDAVLADLPGDPEMMAVLQQLGGVGNAGNEEQQHNDDSDEGLEGHRIVGGVETNTDAAIQQAEEEEQLPEEAKGAVDVVAQLNLRPLDVFHLINRSLEGL